MTILILGCLVFFGVHTISALKLRSQLIARLGANGFKGLYSLGSVLGLALMVIGFRAAGPSGDLWTAPSLLIVLSYALSSFGLFSVVGGNFPSNWRRLVRHPMMMGVLLFSLGHLIANSSARDLVLFSSLAAYSLFSIWSANRRGPWHKANPAPVSYDIAHVLVTAVFLLGLVFWLHGALFGAALAIPTS